MDPAEGDKKAEEELSPREHHCEQAEDFLAKFGLALMRLGRFGGREEDPERAKEHVALLARYHWASGCLEELQVRDGRVNPVMCYVVPARLAYLLCPDSHGEQIRYICDRGCSEWCGYDE
jgi:hypothetical protein